MIPRPSYRLPFCVLALLSLLVAAWPGAAAPVGATAGPPAPAAVRAPSAPIAPLTEQTGRFGYGTNPFPINLAVGKPVTISSELVGFSGGAPRRANDGDRNGKYADLSVSMTQNEHQPWWEVDLGTLTPIDSVRVWNRTDWTPPTPPNLTVLVSSDPFITTTLTGTLAQPGVSAYPFSASGVTNAVSVARLGRYIRIQDSGTTWLQLAEVEVFGASIRSEVNLAQGRMARSSSELVGYIGGNPHRAADGVLNGNYYARSVFISGNQAQPWWEVDLGRTTSINRVRLWNRTDWGGDLLANPVVLVSSVPFTSTVLNETLNQPGVTSYAVSGTVQVNSDLSVERLGRYVRVQLPTATYLQLTEVEVFGPGLALSNLAVGKPAIQSNVNPQVNDPYFNGDPSHAVDGNTDGSYYNSSVTHTYWSNHALYDWWQVDLGAVTDIAAVRLWNRTDCCSDRLRDFHVFVSDSPFATTDLTGTLQQAGVSSFFHAGPAGIDRAFAINRSGRYVRVQLSYPHGVVSLAEAQVWGQPKQPTLQISAPAGSGTFSADSQPAGRLVAESAIWDFGDGVVETGVLTPTHAYAFPGTYRVRLQVRSDTGWDLTGTRTVQVSGSLPATPPALFYAYQAWANALLGGN